MIVMIYSCSGSFMHRKASRLVGIVLKSRTGESVLQLPTHLNLLNRFQVILGMKAQEGTI